MKIASIKSEIPKSAFFSEKVAASIEYNRQLLLHFTGLILSTKIKYKNPKKTSRYLAANFDFFIDYLFLFLSSKLIKIFEAE